MKIQTSPSILVSNQPYLVEVELIGVESEQNMGLRLEPDYKFITELYKSYFKVILNIMNIIIIYLFIPVLLNQCLCFKQFRV